MCCSNEIFKKKKIWSLSWYSSLWSYSRYTYSKCYFPPQQLCKQALKATLCSVVLFRTDRALWISAPGSSVLVVSNNCCGHSKSIYRPVQLLPAVSCWQCRVRPFGWARLKVSPFQFEEKLYRLWKRPKWKKQQQSRHADRPHNRMCLCPHTFPLLWSACVFLRERKNSCMTSGLELITSEEYFYSFNSCSPSFCLK